MRLIRCHAEHIFPGQREGANDQHSDQPNHNRHEDRNYLRHDRVSHQDAARRGMTEDCDGNPPPCESRVEGSSQDPGSEEIPDFSRFVSPALGGKNARDPGEVDAAECKRQDRGPLDTREGQIAQHI